MSVVTTVINQNNETLAYLEDKNYSHAIASSLSALARLRMVSSNNNQGQQQGQPQPNSASGGVSLDRCMLLNEPSCDDDDEDDELESTQTFIYKNGIRLPSTTTTDLDIITPILIFNAALVHHLSAEERGLPGESIEYLQRAKRLYQLAFGSQTLEEQNTLVFRFAIINNIAVIDRQLGNMEESEHNILQLLSVLMLYVDQKNGAALRQLRGFWVNLRRQAASAA